MPHHSEILINAFAFIAFRTVADGDYIAARMAWRRMLFPQYFWLIQQAIEKYLKCILLLHRWEIPRHHDLQRLLSDADRAFPVPLRRSESTDRLINEVNVGPGIRYGEESWDVDRDMRPEFDTCVWELRRYCQAVRVVVDGTVVDTTANVLEAVGLSEMQHPSRFRIEGGHIESILADRRCAARPDLVWRNACFGSRQSRTGAYLNRYGHASNTPAFVWPELLDAVKPFGVYKGFEAAPT